MGGVIGGGIIIAWAGYAVFYYGLTQIQGGNWGFFDLLWPASWTPAKAAIARDGQ